MAFSTTWAPTTNGDVLTMTASPDNSRIYIGGSFTDVNGSIPNRIGALDPTTGALVGSFQPKPDASVKAIVATSSLELGIDMGAVVTGQRHLDQCREGKAGSFRVEQRHLGADQAGFLERTDAPPAGGWGHPDAFGQLGVGQPAIGLQQVQKLPVLAGQAGRVGC